jgi:hypothetical protein
MTTVRSGLAFTFSLVFLLAACGGATDSDAAGGSGGSGTGGTSAGGGSGTSGAPGCSWNGAEYVLGETWKDACNTCTCDASGPSCTLMDCGCEYAGNHYDPGDSFLATDGCNQCSCQDDGTVLCTETDCVALECVYAGTEYPLGASFPALDGCNTCSCTDAGVICTKQACTCDPAQEWWRFYVAFSPAECAVIDYACPPNTIGFQNECGCGCEQDASCPKIIDCKGPTDCNELVDKCPYSMATK